MIRHRTPGRSGAGAVQLIVVLAILLILLALLAPAVARVREAAARAQSMNNLRQLALACHNAHDTFQKFPPTVGDFVNKTGSLHFFLLPFVEQQNASNMATNAVWDNDVWGHRIDVFIDRRDPAPPPGGRFEDWLATTNYAANWMVFRDGPGGLMITQITDGTSNTIMFAQRYQVCGGVPTAWGYPSLYTWAPMVGYYDDAPFQQSPRPDECDPMRPQAIGGTMLIALCDGSGRAVNPRVSAQTWANLLDPADGNALGTDF